MLLPRYSIRWILLLTTLCAFSFIVIAQAVRGQSWAIAGSAVASSSAVVLMSLVGILIPFARRAGRLVPERALLHTFPHAI